MIVVIISPITVIVRIVIVVGPTTITPGIISSELRNRNTVTYDDNST